jgi:hypothetical protein
MFIWFMVLLSLGTREKIRRVTFEFKIQPWMRSLVYETTNDKTQKLRTLENTTLHCSQLTSLIQAFHSEK